MSDAEEIRRIILEASKEITDRYIKLLSLLSAAWVLKNGTMPVAVQTGNPSMPARTWLQECSPPMAATDEAVALSRDLIGDTREWWTAEPECVVIRVVCEDMSVYVTMTREAKIDRTLVGHVEGATK